MIPREKIGGAVGTIIFAVLFLLILLFSYFTIASPPQGLEGIPVMFGTQENAGGDMEPPFVEPTPPEPAPQIQPQVSAPRKPLVTQNQEPSISVAEQKKKEEERRRQEEATRQQREEEARKREINRQMSGLFGENAGSRGQTQGAGTQGVSTGNASQGAASGIGGIGTYDLGGRSLGSGGLAQPGYSVNDYGTVVVNITVDPHGNVINAEIGRGTNTPNTSLRNEALRAARRTKFNAINSTNNQQGTITYKFNLN